MDSTVIATASQGSSIIIRGAVGLLSNQQLIDAMKQVNAGSVILCAVDGTVLGTFTLIGLCEVYG